MLQQCLRCDQWEFKRFYFEKTRENLDFILRPDDFSPLVWTIVRQIRPFKSMKDPLNIFNSISLFMYVYEFTDYYP